LDNKRKLWLIVGCAIILVGIGAIMSIQTPLQPTGNNSSSNPLQYTISVFTGDNGGNQGTENQKKNKSVKNESTKPGITKNDSGNFAQIAKIRCTTCGGDGKVTCNTCNGIGKVWKPNGDMLFPVTCTNCGGTGFVKCSKCGGTGWVNV